MKGMRGYIEYRKQIRRPAVFVGNVIDAMWFSPGAIANAVWSGPW